jgi:outer membrane biosynthesis protein TonB
MTRMLVGLCIALASTSAQIHATGSQESGPLPQTCEAPPSKDSSLTIKIRLTPEAASRVVFDHPKPKAALPAGIIGQSMVCVCVDATGRIEDPVKLMRQSGSSVLDTEALEIGKTMVYPASHPGCMRDTINFY